MNIIFNTNSNTDNSNTNSNTNNSNTNSYTNEGKEEIRQVLIDNDQTSSANVIFGRGSAEPIKGHSDLYKDLGPDGSPIVMNIEMNNENLQKGTEKKEKGKGGQSKKGGASKKKK